MAALPEQISDNLRRVHEKIAQAAERSGRSLADITLVAVTKYVDEHAARALVTAGCRHLGESRPQVLWDKAQRLADLDVCWHQIGHLQRNKLKRTLPLVSLVHSVDSLRLMEAIDQECISPSVSQNLSTGRPSIDILLEVNVSGDVNKHGFSMDELTHAIERADSLSSVRLKGLMAMGSLEGGREQARRDFSCLRSLRDALVDQLPADISLPELSMGMSGDFDIAIEEGATIVRVGSALFDGIHS